MTRATATAERLIFQGPALADLAAASPRTYADLWQRSPDYWSRMFEPRGRELVASPYFLRMLELERDAIERAHKLPRTAKLASVRSLFDPEVMEGRAQLLRADMIAAIERLGPDGFEDACECSRFMQARIMRALIETADFATWITCASASRVARVANCSRMAVHRALPLLTKRGFIARIARHDPRTGASLPNVYVIASYALIAAAPPTRLPGPRKTSGSTAAPTYSAPPGTVAGGRVSSPHEEPFAARGSTEPQETFAPPASEAAPSSADAQLWSLYLDTASADRGFRLVDDLKPRDRRAVCEAAREMIAQAEAANLPDAWPWTVRTMDRAYRALDSKHLRAQSWALKWTAGDLNAIKAATRSAIRARVAELRHVAASLPATESEVIESNASRAANARAALAATETRRR